MKRILIIVVVLGLLTGGLQSAPIWVSPDVVEAWGGPGDDPDSDFDAVNGDDDADDDGGDGGDDDSSDPDE